MTPQKRQTHRQPHSPSLIGRCSAFLSACLRGLCVESVLVTVEIPAGIDRIKAWDSQFLWSLDVGRFVLISESRVTLYESIRPNSTKKIRESGTAKNSWSIGALNRQKLNLDWHLLTAYIARSFDKIEHLCDVPRVLRPRNR